MKFFYKISFLICTFILGWAVKGKSQLVANFTASKISGCVPLQVSFTNLSTGNPSSYFWDFGNSNNSTLANPSANYVVPGTYTVTLIVNNGTGSNSKTIPQYITVYPLPIVNFDALPRIGCAPLSVQFRDSSLVSQSSITQWAWDFGNGNISTSRNPVNYYNIPGSYKVSLQATDANGCSNIQIKNNYIQTVAAPVVDFTSSQNLSCTTPFNVNFSASVQPPGAYQYLWDFGNQSSGNTANSSTTYLQNGIYPVKLKVSTPQCTVEVVKPSFIQIRKITPDFAISGIPDLCEPGKLSIINTSSFDTLGMTYEWRLNGNVVGNVKNLNLNNLPVGTYTLSLKLSLGTCHAFTEKTAFFTVLPASRSNFDAPRTLFCKVPQMVQFRDSSENAISWLWNFGNGQTSTQRHPTHTYNSFGTYTITLITTHSNGCRDTFFRDEYIRIWPPYIKPNANPDKGCAPLNVSFNVTDTNNMGFGNFQWTLSNGSIPATGPNPTYTYNSDGTYIAEVTATNNEGCIAKGKDTITVGTPVSIDFSSPKKLYCRSELPVTMTVTTIPNLPPNTFNWIINDSLSNQTGRVLNFRDTGWKHMTLTVNYNGCISTLHKDSVLRVVGPTANFEIMFNHCSKSFVTFNNRSMRSFNKFVWDFGNGKKDSNTLSPTHVYDSAGTYWVRLTMIDTILGCSATTLQKLIVPKDFTPSFRIDPKSGCAPFSVTLTNTSVPASEIASTQFVVGARIYNTHVANALIGAPGKYSVTMIVTDKKGCTYTLTKVDSIIAYGASALPIINPMFGCAPMQVNVKDSSRVEGRTMRRIWYWGNGDSTVYTHQDSIFSRYVYAKGPAVQNDGYTIMLVVVDSMGCRHFASRKLFIARPTPSFTSTQIKTCGSDSFIFTPPEDRLVGLTPLKYQWSILGSTQHTKIGRTLLFGDTSLPVQLKVTDVYGCADSITLPIKVLTGPPKPNFDATPKYIQCPGPPVYFFDFSKPGSSPITQWNWSFGDGGISDLKEPSRIYLVPGSYSVKLKLTDSLGCTAETAIPDLVVIGGPKTSYQISPKLGCAPLQVNFSAFGTNVQRYEWDLADGTKDTQPNLTHIYTRPGIYVPNLSLVDSSGCKVGMPPVDTLHVFANPMVDFSVSKRVNCLGNDLKIFSLVQPDTTIIDYLWWIDGNQAKGKGPIDYLCNRIGNIPITLMAIDYNGCSGTKTDSLAILVFKDSIAPPAPLINRVTVNSDEQVQVDIKASDEPDLDYYQVMCNFINGISTHTRTPIASWDTVQLFDYLNTLQYNYSYQVRAVDACKNVSLPSAKHTTIELKAAPLTNAVSLHWTPYQGWDSVSYYSVFRLNEQSGIFEKIARVDGAQHHFIDSAIFCHKVMRYKVRGEFQTFMSWSDSAAAIPLFEPTTPSTRAVRATVLDNKAILVQWWRKVHDYRFQYQVTRTSLTPSPQTKVFLVDSKDSFLVDKEVDVLNVAYSYVVQLKDECGGLGKPSNLARNIILSLEVKTNDKLTENPELTWEPYLEWVSGVERYELYFRNDSLQLDELIATRMPSDSLKAIHPYIHFEQDDYCYYVVAYQKDSTWIESHSNLACMNTMPRLFAPNAFTVNRDQLNDQFLVSGIFVKEFSLEIFDRWGTLVFKTNNLHEGWDGTFEGQDAKSDVYVFIAKAWGRKGKFASVKGNVTLLR